MEDFARVKGIECPAIYLIGGAGCIIAGYLERATVDFDFIDINYPAKAGRLFKILDRFDMLDLYVTPVAPGFEKRAIKIDGFDAVYVLSREDIIVSKLGRYSEKDKEDIKKLMISVDKEKLKELIELVIDRKDFSPRVKDHFIKNVEDFEEKYNV
jgi:hypothetical protein